MVRIVYSTSAKAVIPKLEEIFSEFGYPEEEFKSDNGSPFNSSEFKDYCKSHGFQAKPITPEEPKANGTSENFMKNFAKTIQTAISEKKDWRKELNIFLRNYRATLHQTTGKSPAEIMFPNRNFQVKLPSMREVERYHSDQVLRDRDASKKAAMKKYADSKKYVKEHGMNIGDMVLVPSKKRNKFSTPYKNEKYYVVRIKGSMITAENERRARFTRDASKFKKVNFQEKNKKQVRDFDWSNEETEQSTMTTDQPELPQGQTAQLQTQEATSRLR